MSKHVIFLNGPVGVGKTTLGRALAATIDAGFIDGDDFSDPGRPWYCSIRRTSEAVVSAALAILEQRSFAVIAYPLNCVTWVYYRRRFGAAAACPVFVSLRASYEGITSPLRLRRFSVEEHARIKTMIRQGYAERPFSDLIIDTDKASFEATLDRLASEVLRIVR